ncbi:MAG: DUF421 domain-containing protein [Gemmiger sp.]
MQQALSEIAQVILFSVVSLVAMFLLSRLDGKRQIAQMSMFDYVNSVTIGSIAAELATNLEQWYRPLTAMLIYGVVTWLVHYAACRNLRIRSILGGRAVTLMDHGTIYKKELKKAAIDLNEFLGQARVAGYFDLNEIQSALLETSGQISFLPKSSNRPLTPEDMQLTPEKASTWIDLILDGVVMPDNLKKSGHDRIWLETQLHRQGIGQSSEVFYAACDKGTGFFACRSQ